MVSNIFYFHPFLGKIPISTNIFQMGWNYQPVVQVAVGCFQWFSELENVGGWAVKPEVFFSPPYLKKVGDGEASKIFVKVLTCQIGKLIRFEEGKKPPNTRTPLPMENIFLGVNRTPSILFLLEILTNHHHSTGLSGPGKAGSSSRQIWEQNGEIVTTDDARNLTNRYPNRPKREKKKGFNNQGSPKHRIFFTPTFNPPKKAFFFAAFFFQRKQHHKRWLMSTSTEVFQITQAPMFTSLRAEETTTLTTSIVMYFC